MRSFLFFILALVVLVVIAGVFGITSSRPCAQAGTAPRNGSGNPSPLARHYEEGERLRYHMKASNQGRSGTIRYEADASGLTRKDAAGHYLEEFRWSDLSFNGQTVALPSEASGFRQLLSLDPSIRPSPPDFSHVNPMLIAPSADLLSFYADLWLAIQQPTLARSGDHVYVKHGRPASWADGMRTLVGEDSIDFDLTLVELNREKKTAKVLVRHVVPERPAIHVPTGWMEAPVGVSRNNWVEVSKTEKGKYLAEIGQEAFSVEMITSLGHGEIVSATMDNPVLVLARECRDQALTESSSPEHYQIRRQIELASLP